MLRLRPKPYLPLQAYFQAQPRTANQETERRPGLVWSARTVSGAAWPCRPKAAAAAAAAAAGSIINHSSGGSAEAATVESYRG